MSSESKTIDDLKSLKTDLLRLAFQRKNASRWWYEERKRWRRWGYLRISPPHRDNNTYSNSSLQGHSSEEELGGFQPHGDGARAGKKTKGRVKIKMEFIDNKLRRFRTLKFFLIIELLLFPFLICTLVLTIKLVRPQVHNIFEAENRNNEESIWTLNPDWYTSEEALITECLHVDEYL